MFFRNVEPQLQRNFLSHTLTSYYPDDNKKTETDAEGNVTSYKYDAYGNEIEKTNPDGTVNVTEYDGLQREKATYFKSKSDANKQILTSTEYEFVRNHGFDVYTALDSSSSKSCSGLKTIKKTYITADKQVVNETLADWKENTVYEKTNGETKRTSAYYANGQLARQTDALGNTTKYEYGKLNKLTKTYTPFNGKEKYSVTENQYDKNGNIILTKQTVQKEGSSTAKYSITQNEYNGLGLLSMVTLSGTGSNEKNITQYFYNHDGIETEMRTGLSSDNDTSYLKTEYVYDSRNHLVSTKDSTGYNSGTITYDLNGNVLTNTDANGNVTTNTYDALNRVLTANTVNSKDSSKNVSKSYTYDKMGRITKTTSNNFTTTTIYDFLGRKYTETEYDGNNYSIFRGFFYEGVSQYVSRELTGQYHLLIYSYKEYEYDGEMRVVKVKESGNDTVSYTYDANGNKKSETLANGVTSTYTYNNNNKVTGITNKKGNSTISSYEYSYYLDGSDACKVRSESGIIETTSYEYDGLKRLTEESVAKGSNTDTYSYEYDDYGNRSKMTATGTEDYVTEYSYSDSNGKYTALLQKETKIVEGEENPIDLNSNVKQTVYTYDANGNQIKKTAEGKTETNTYDGLNQLIGFNDGETTASYKYNASGLRYEKTVDGQTINHVWDGNQQIVADVIDNQFYEADCYIRGTNLVAKYNYWNGDKSEYTYYTQNAHGDVVNLTDKDGKVTKNYRYDAFGVEKDIDENDTNVFRYCGEYYDKETVTVYLRARYYNPSTGRFISRDSYAGKLNDPLSLNLYTYCANNPVIFTDPLGHDYYYFFGDHIDEDGDGKDDNSGQEESAIINKAELEKNGEVVHMYEISSSDDFQNNWKNINPTENDSIIINFHGNPDNVKYMNLDTMNMKNAGYVYLLACSAADQKVKNNFAERFFNANNFSCMVACDGTNYRSTVTVTHHKWWDIANWFNKIQYYVELSVVKNDVDVGPSDFSMGYVAYTKDAESSDKNSVGSIGNKFNGISKMIEAAHKYRENLK